MKHRLLLIFAVLFAVSVANSAESFNSIYSKNITARGGSETVKSAKTFIICGELIRQDSIHFHFRAAYKLPNKLVVEYYLKSDTAAVGYDGKNAWTIMPQVSNDVIELPQSAAEEAIAITITPIIDLFNRLDIFKDNRSKVKVSDDEFLDSVPQFKLLCPNKTGDTDVIMVNKTDYQISRINTNYKIRGKFTPTTILLSDYRLTNTLTMPYYVKISEGADNLAELKLSSVELNPELDDIIFETPKLIK